MSRRKDVEHVVREARKQGFIVDRTSTGHWRLRTADGVFVVMLAGTPSDSRGLLNALARLKRAGMVWPPP
jgi:hypothetical protein